MNVATNYKSEISKIPIVVKYELLKQVRRLRLYGVMLAGSLVTGVGLVLALVLGSSLGGIDALGFALLVVSMGGSLLGLQAFAVIAGVFFSGDAISSEFEHKTGYLMFANPIKRTTLLVGKYFSTCISCLLALAIPYLLVSLAVIMKFGEFPPEIFASFLFAVLYAWSVSALTFVFSSLFRGAMGATALPFLLFYFVFPLISGIIMELGGIEPFIFLNYGADIMYNVLSNPYPPHKISFAISVEGYTLQYTTYYAGLAEGLIIMLSYLIVSLIISALLMRRRQMQ
jgi:ABC-type transport system involved in multi-copper enzyme maturation permease subunit